LRQLIKTAKKKIVVCSSRIFVVRALGRGQLAYLDEAPQDIVPSPFHAVDSIVIIYCEPIAV